MTATCAPDAVAAVVAAMRARTGYRSPWTPAATGIPVYHSLEVGAQNETLLPALLVIADTGDPEAPSEAADGTQRPAVLGTTRGRAEEARIRCRAVAQTGSLIGAGQAEALWASAHQVVTDVHEELAGASPRIGPSLGLSTATYASVVATLDQVTAILAYQTPRGSVVEILFDLLVKARL